MILSDYVVDTSSYDLWALFNGINGLICLYLWEEGEQAHDWMIILYLLHLSGCYFDVLWWGELVSWASFKGAIDLIFMGEIAILFCVGGRDAADHVRNLVVRWRDIGSGRATWASQAVIARVPRD